MESASEAVNYMTTDVFMKCGKSIAKGYRDNWMMMGFASFYGCVMAGGKLGQHVSTRGIMKSEIAAHLAGYEEGLFDAKAKQDAIEFNKKWAKRNKK